MTPEITSRQNPRIKAVAALRDARGRARAGRYVIDGARELGRALAAGVGPVEGFVCHELCGTAEAREVARELEKRAHEVWQVPPGVFEKIAFGHRADGVLAVARIPETGLDRIRLGANPLVVVLVGLEKPGNVGAILRSADAAGAAAALVVDGGADLFNPNCIRASLGVIFSLPVATCDSAAALAWLAERSFKVYAARPQAELVYTDADYQGATALVLGAEASGLPTPWTGASTIGVRLPMLGTGDSLNVSVTAGVLLYEAVRQRSRTS